ncbi:ABC transporter permease [Actinomyces vulturis]|uniref:ABC transporter permease n=1 Tax=Actinomyces vulturis TaxID=1857645 RepID=UPI00082BEAD0|nr:FtsX-like permease family protein [Actinomyces vulturis]
MKSLLLGNLRSHGRRYAATGTAVGIAAMFVLLALIFFQTITHSITSGITSTYENVSVVATFTNDAYRTDNASDSANSVETTKNAESTDNTENTGSANATENTAASETTSDTQTTNNQQNTDGSGEVATSALNATDALHVLQSQPGVRAVARKTFSMGTLQPSGNSPVFVAPAPVEPFHAPSLLEGHWPTANNEVVLPDDYAKEWNLHVGEQTVFRVDAFDDRDAASTLTISGIYQAPKVQIHGPYVSETFYAKAFPASNTSGYFIAMDGVGDSEEAQVAAAERLKSSLERSADPVAQLVGRSMEFSSGHAVMQEELDTADNQSTSAMITLLIFPIITVFVAIIVIASSFRVLLQQRRRELALLRAIGTTRPQLRRLLMAETVLLGVVAGGIGVGVASVLGAWGQVAGGYAASMGEAFEAVSPAHVIIVWVAAVLITVLIGLRPIAGSSRTSPMKALSQAGMHDEVESGHMKSTVVGVLLLVVGLALIDVGLMVFSQKLSGFGLAVLGSLASLTGLLMVTSAHLWRLTSALGKPLKGVVAQLARANTRRNPGRTAATGTASIIGIALIVMLAVGAASTKATLLTEIDSRRPFDLMLDNSGEPMTMAQIDEVAGLESIAAIEPLYRAPITVTDPADGSEYSDMAINAVDDINHVTHSEVPAPSAGVVVVPLTLKSAHTVTICVENHECGDFKTVTYPRLDTTVILMTTEDAKVLDPDIALDQALVKLAPDTRVDRASMEIQQVLPNATVSGSAQERELYTGMINQIFLVLAGLVGVSVVVALVGLTNTLSLSVLERVHENGLLRALGLTRKQMQRTLLIEALLINTSGLLIGIGAGVFYGIVGTYALPLDTSAVIIEIPWGIVGAVVVVSTVAAVVASLVPGRKASKVPPTEALASE